MFWQTVSRYWKNNYAESVSLTSCTKYAICLNIFVTNFKISIISTHAWLEVHREYFLVKCEMSWIQCQTHNIDHPYFTWIDMHEEIICQPISSIRQTDLFLMKRIPWTYQVYRNVNTILWTVSITSRMTSTSSKLWLVSEMETIKGNSQHLIILIRVVEDICYVWR